MAQEYKGENVVISYDKKVCSHAGKCVAGLPDVFNPEKDPWCQPGSISFEDAKPVIAQCPSGALSIKHT